jgi:K+-transporting ATPase KdpF subunit
MMNFETIVGLILAVLALGYLLYALLRPEEL